MSNKLKFLLFIFIAVAAGAIYYLYLIKNDSQNFEGFAKGNGRIETTQIDIATKLPGRLLEVYVEEGDIVEKGAVLAKLDTKELEAKLHAAQASVEQAKQSKSYALSIVEQRKSELAFAQKNYERTTALYKDKSIPLFDLQKDETSLRSAKAALSAAKSQVVSAAAAIQAAQAQVETINVNIDESTLYSPIKGRVLYKIAENGEILGAGSKVLIVLDLLNTYMTVFLPTSQAGLVDIGSDARIVIDALPNLGIPASVTFISPLAQFTPKEIETQTEREKLMFRIKVKIAPQLLEQYFERIKTGLPGIAYIQLDKNASWPHFLNTIPVTQGK